MYEDERFRSFHPNATKITKIDNYIGIANYWKQAVIFAYTLKYFDANGRRIYPPNVSFVADVWTIGEKGKIFRFPASLMLIASTQMFKGLALPVAGKFGKQKGSLYYELDGIRYKMPFDTEIEFSNSIPQGVKGEPIRKGPPRAARKEKTSEW